MQAFPGLRESVIYQYTQANTLIHQHAQADTLKGGLLTIPFIIANEAFEKVASFGLLPNMIFYLTQEYHMEVAKGTNLILLWSAATNVMTLLGAFLSDSYFGRFLTIGFGSIVSLLGMLLLSLTAWIPNARPPPCQWRRQSCKSPTTDQMMLLISSFALMSIGAGGIRPCSLSFGADQLVRRDNSKNQRVLKSYFAWYYASTALSIMIALTGIVYIQVHLGWKVGFGVPVILMFLSASLFVLASPFYVKERPSKSLFTSFAQVLVAALRKRELPMPPRDSHRWYHHDDSKLVAPTSKLRFLNRACIMSIHEKDMAAEGLAIDPWSLCTTEQVEELKALLRIIPLWSTGIMASISISHSPFPLLQANSMDRHITSSFQIPPASFAMFAIITLLIWVALYESVMLPLASKIRGKPVRLGAKTRMGIGILFCCMAMVVSAAVENRRRKKAINEGPTDHANAARHMSALWLVPQYCLIGLAEAFSAIGQIEFYYNELPKSLSGIANALFGLGIGFGNLAASVIVSTVDEVTSRGGKVSWVSKNINKARYDYYYCLLAGMMFINFLYFLVCSWSYGPGVEQVEETKVSGRP